MGRPKSITDDIRQRVFEQRSKTRSIRDIAKSVGISVGSVSTILNESTDFKEIDSIDRRLKEIALQQDRLKSEADRLQQVRYDKFVRTGGTVRYSTNVNLVSGEAEIYVESSGRKQVLYKDLLYMDEPPIWVLKKVPECYHDDFVTVWKIAKADIDKQVACIRDSMIRQDEEFCNLLNEVKNSSLKDITPEHSQQIIRTLIKVFHPDNAGNAITITNDDREIIKDVLRLKTALNV